ncbi:hypothetical protein DFH09DRAFT_918220 [Mycena vulgaris]|nr:hypothetical protein DFH09DRAFT_918220 [Mycena vulgaris]
MPKQLRDVSTRLRSASPPRRNSVPNHPSFRQGARASDGVAPCAVCLGRYRDNVGQCNATVLWNGSTASRARRNAKGHLINPNDDIICLFWQKSSSCNLNHSSRHECSGCGSPAHGAQACSLAQKL